MEWEGQDESRGTRGEERRQAAAAAFNRDGKLGSLEGCKAGPGQADAAFVSYAIIPRAREKERVSLPLRACASPICVLSPIRASLLGGGRHRHHHPRHQEHPQEHEHDSAGGRGPGGAAVACRAAAPLPLCCPLPALCHACPLRRCPTASRAGPGDHPMRGRRLAGPCPVHVQGCAVCHFLGSSIAPAPWIFGYRRWRRGYWIGQAFRRGPCYRVCLGNSAPRSIICVLSVSPWTARLWRCYGNWSSWLFIWSMAFGVSLVVVEYYRWVCNLLWFAEAFSLASGVKGMAEISYRFPVLAQFASFLALRIALNWFGMCLTCYEVYQSVRVCDTGCSSPPHCSLDTLFRWSGGVIHINEMHYNLAFFNTVSEWPSVP